MTAKTTVVENGKEIPFDEWEKMTRQKLKIKILCARSAEDLADVSRELRSLATIKYITRGCRSGCYAEYR